MRRPLIALLPTLLVLSACGGAEDTKQATAADGGQRSSTLNLVAYSTPEVVYEELIPGFQRTHAGTGVEVKGSYGASGDQSRAVEAGLKADVVSFSIEPDMTRLEEAGLVAPGSAERISTSQVVFIVRKGNPKGIRTWDDLLGDGVEVVTPNPFTSGAAKWNLLGAYGGPKSGRGLAFVSELLEKHVEVQPKSGREALQTFLDGQGDVLLSYAYEATTAQRKGERDIDVVVPDDTIAIDILIAPTTGAPEQARAFIAYARGPEGQRFFADWGYGAPDAEQGDFTIDDLGGWKKVDEDLFDPDDGSLARLIER